MLKKIINNVIGLISLVLSIIAFGIITFFVFLFGWYLWEEGIPRLLANTWHDVWITSIIFALSFGFILLIMNAPNLWSYGIKKLRKNKKS